MFETRWHRFCVNLTGTSAGQAAGEGWVKRDAPESNRRDGEAEKQDNKHTMAGFWTVVTSHRKAGTAGKPWVTMSGAGPSWPNPDSPISAWSLWETRRYDATTTDTTIPWHVVASQIQPYFINFIKKIISLAFKCKSISWLNGSLNTNNSTGMWEYFTLKKKTKYYTPILTLATYVLSVIMAPTYPLFIG